METTLSPQKTAKKNAVGAGSMDVLIVSAFGRGNWLATHLAEQDWRVCLVDVTPSLGPWEPADWDGPFGLFESDALLPSQKRQWLQETEASGRSSASASASAGSGGFTFWLPSGPLEGHGELSGFLSSQHNVSAETRAYLQLLGDVDDSELKRERFNLRRRKFQDSWLAHLAHQVAANVYEDNDVALGAGRAIPFYSPYFQRSVYANRLEEGLRSCESHGVKALRRAAVASLRFDGTWPSREWAALQLNDGTELSAHAGVWMLSSVETEAVNATLTSELFPKGKLEPSWCWLRFEMSVALTKISDSMPASFAIVGDIFSPWTHANLAHVHKQSLVSSAQRQGLDAWARVPLEFRFERAYLERVQAELMSLLQTKLPASDLTAERLPLDLERGAEALRAPRWAIYPTTAPAAALRIKNFVVDGPEQWNGLDPLAQFQSQKKILTALEHQKRLRDERTAREELREQKRQAREQGREVARSQREQREQARRQEQENDRD